MRLPRVRFPVRCVALVLSVVAVLTATAAVTRGEDYGREAAIGKARDAYIEAKRVRERAEAELDEYSGRTYPRELAAAERERERTEEALAAVRAAVSGDGEWARRLRDKGYLLYVPGGVTGRLTLDRAVFEAEQASTRKNVLEKYTRARVLSELKDRIAKARAAEESRRADYGRATKAQDGTRR